MLARLGPLPAADYRHGPFVALLRAVIGQQLSSRAAASIAGRLYALTGTPPTPQAVLALAEGELRGCGLSMAKSRSVLTLSRAVLDGSIDLVHLAAVSDEAVAAKLTVLPGIGPWTVHMFLMFGLGRLDVFAPGDLGLRRAVQRLENLPDLPTPATCLVRAERWRPYRTVAAWQLWRWLG